MTFEKKIYYIALTNEGYIEYTNNLLESIKANNCDIQLNIYAIDKKSYDYFKTKTNTIYLETNTEVINNFTSQTDNQFGYLMVSKFAAIHNALLNEEMVVYIDGDIVIKKNFENLLLNNMDNRDIIFQNDKRPSKPNELKLCAGFMCIRSNKKTLKFFEPTEKLLNKFLKYKTHDQTHINKNKSKFKYGVLSLKDFPNGPYFYENYGTFEPYIIHFNFLIGEIKKQKMIDYGEWYLEK